VLAEPSKQIPQNISESVTRALERENNSPRHLIGFSFAYRGHLDDFRGGATSSAYFVYAPKFKSLKVTVGVQTAVVPLL
jgi:hypothetical protein